MNSKSKLLMGVWCGVLAALTACRRENNPSSVAATERVALTQNEIYEREFLRLVVGSNMTVHATQTDVNKLCNDIDKAEALRGTVLFADRTTTYPEFDTGIEATVSLRKAIDISTQRTPAKTVFP